MGFQETLSEIESWPLEQQFRLAQLLNDRLAEQTMPPELVEQDNQRPLSDELRAELLRRIAELEAHPETAVPWEEVEAKAFPPEWNDDLRAELERRKARLDQNPELGVPWEVARERARKRLNP